MSTRRPLVPALAAALLFAPACSRSPYKGPVSAHFDGARFHNEAPAFHPGLWDVLWWQLTSDRIPWPDRVAGPAPRKPVDRVDAGALRVTFVSHSTFLIQTAGVNVLTDPVWSDRVGPTSWLGPTRHHAAGVRFADLPTIAAVLISHDHYDHFDLPTLRRLEARDAPLILSGLGNGALLDEEGLGPHAELDWWDCRQIKTVRICALPAQHNSRRGLLDGDETLWTSYWIASDDESLYFAWDTGFGPHFAEIRERLGAPCIALVPIGAYKPRWIMSGNHMNPEDAVRAHDVLGSSMSVAMHFATFEQSDEGMYEPAGELGLALASGRHAPFVVPDFGQAFEPKCRIDGAAR